MVLRSLLLSLLVGALPYPALSQKTPEPKGTKFEILPIASFDTDAGLGYGAKCFLLNAVRWRESLDLVLFQSTKGERWYRLVFSVPDFELRQGSTYPLALDLTFDYDKWISYSFFGEGNAARFDDRETYTREPFEVSALISRGFSETFVGQAGLRFRWISNISAGPILQALPPAENASVAKTVGILLSGRYDSRNSYINPSRGTVVQTDLELAPDVLWANVNYLRSAIWLQHYLELGWLGSVLALRSGLEIVSGPDLPIQVLTAIGGNRTVRGSVQDRYLDRIGAVANIELRIPVVWRFGCILGADAGKVWHNAGQMDLHRWAFNPVIGLRLYMDTFVVRADVGFGRESTGFFLNFGQLF
jgi:outer membrane protein assembly factor BamA